MIEYIRLGKLEGHGEIYADADRISYKDDNGEEKWIGHEWFELNSDQKQRLNFMMSEAILTEVLGLKNQINKPFVMHYE